MNVYAVIRIPDDYELSSRAVSVHSTRPLARAAVREELRLQYVYEQVRALRDAPADGGEPWRYCGGDTFRIEEWVVDAPPRCPPVNRPLTKQEWRARREAAVRLLPRPPTEEIYRTRVKVFAELCAKLGEPTDELERDHDAEVARTHQYYEECDRIMDAHPEVFAIHKEG